MLNILSLFSGLGSFELALSRLNVPLNIVGFSEIEKSAITAYCKLHGISQELNLGDITQVQLHKDFPRVDLLTHGSPCQSFSSSGKQLGGNPNSGTKSSLMWHSVEIIKQLRPTVVIWENVKNVLNKRHRVNFDLYIDTLAELGYQSSYAVLNALDTGIPQNRERIIVVSHLNKKPPVLTLTQKPLLPLSEVLDTTVEENLYLKNLDLVFQYSKTKQLPTDNALITGALRGRKDDEGIYRQRLELLARPIFNTLTSVPKDNLVMSAKGIRTLSTKEYMRLMGLTPENIADLLSLNLPKNKMYLLAGNSISVPMLEEVFKSLIEAEILTW